NIEAQAGMECGSKPDADRPPPYELQWSSCVSSRSKKDDGPTVGSIGLLKERMVERPIRSGSGCGSTPYEPVANSRSPTYPTVSSSACSGEVAWGAVVTIHCPMSAG